MKPRLLMPVAELTRRCAEEMARYKRRQRSDPRYCYELFRCALAEGDEEAWAAIYSQYHGLVRCWLGNAPGDVGPGGGTLRQHELGHVVDGDDVAVLGLRSLLAGDAD